MITWITDQIGTAPKTETAFSEQYIIIDVRDLVDKTGNSIDIVKGKISHGVQQLQQGKKIVVCCDYGISRSNSVAAGILAKYKNIPLEEAIRQVILMTGKEGLKIDVLDIVRKSLDLPQDEYEKKRLLITGGSGFIGTTLLKRLGNNHDEIISPNRHEVDLFNGAINLDLIVKEQQIKTIIHLANPRIYTTNDALGTSLVVLKNVLDVCLKNDLFLFFLSSWEVFSGYRSKEFIVDETIPFKPNGTYGLTKMFCELLISEYQKEGLRVLILRSSPVYGVMGDRPRFLWTFIEKALTDEDIITHCYKNGFPALDLLYIDDLISALVKAIEKPFEGIIHLGSGKAITTAETAETIVYMTRSKSTIHHIDIDNYSANIVMDCRLAKEKIEWEPQRTFPYGIIEMIERTKVLYKL